MSQPRHQPRKSPNVKLRLRLPTDGSVDFDQLRAALEARLKEPPAPPSSEVIPEPVPQPEVLPEPAKERPPSQIWAWVSNNAPTTVALFTAVLAFTTGMIWIGQKSTGDGEAAPALAWVMGVNILMFLGAFGLVVVRQLKIHDSAANHVWTEIKANPKKAYVPALVFAGVVALVFIGLTILQAPSGTERAEGKPTPKTKTVTSPTTGQPRPTNNIPIPPPTPSPETPSAEPESSWGPTEGAGKRLAGVALMGGFFGACLLGITRYRKTRYPDAQSLQAASRVEHFDFTRCFRVFLALQGAYVLVACATGVLYALGWSLTDKFGLTVLWFSVGIGGAGLLVFGAGAVGLNLLTQLDRKIAPGTNGSAASRYLLRKLWVILFGGVLVGGTGLGIVQEQPDFMENFMIGSLGLGQAVAYFWGGTKLVQPKQSAPKISSRQGALRIAAILSFNLPLLFVLSAALWAGVMLLTGGSWKHLWWGMPIGFLMALGLCMGARAFPRIIRYWQNILGIPAIAAFVLDWLVWPGFFWWGFVGLAAMMAFGTRKTRSTTGEEDQGWMLVLPEHRGDYQPVIHPTRDGLEVRWFQFCAVCLVILALSISAGGYVWGYDSPVINDDPQARVEQKQDETELKGAQPVASENRYVPIKPPRGDKGALKQAVWELAGSNYFSGSAEQKLARAWVHYMHKGHAIAAYNYAFMMLKLDENAGHEVRSSFGRGASEHVPSMFNHGCMELLHAQEMSEHARSLGLSQGKNWYGSYRRKQFVELTRESLISAERYLKRAYEAGHPHAEEVLIAVYGQMDLHGFKPIYSTFKKQFSGKPFNPGPFELDRSDVIVIE